MYYAKIRRERAGIYNICGTFGQLTWDHVPHQGGIELTRVEMQSVLQVLAGGSEGFKVAESQNGVKYRTICKKCNEIMGRRYDPVLNDFAISIGGYLKSTLTLPPVIQHRTKPAALIRGILGHLVASKVVQDKANFDRDVSPTIIDESKPIPDSIHIFYWLFPYDLVCTIRDIAMMSLLDRSKSIGYCQIFKYFPIAYLITDLSEYQGLDQLTNYRHLSLTDEVQIPIRLTNVKPREWPEATNDGSVIVGGQSFVNSVFASRKRSRQQA